MSGPQIHWLGGAYVTPACGAWAWAAGVRTDRYGDTNCPPSWTVPAKRVTCRACLKLLRRDKKAWAVYHNRKRLRRQLAAQVRAEVRRVALWVRKVDVPSALVEDVRRCVERIRKDLAVLEGKSDE